MHAEAMGIMEPHGKPLSFMAEARGSKRNDARLARDQQRYPETLSQHLKGVEERHLKTLQRLSEAARRDRDSLEGEDRAEYTAGAADEVAPEPDDDGVPIIVLVPSDARRRGRGEDRRDGVEGAVSTARVVRHVSNDHGQSWFLGFDGNNLKGPNDDAVSAPVRIQEEKEEGGRPIPRCHSTLSGRLHPLEPGRPQFRPMPTGAGVVMASTRAASDREGERSLAAVDAPPLVPDGGPSLVPKRKPPVPRQEQRPLLQSAARLRPRDNAHKQGSEPQALPPSALTAPANGHDNSTLPMGKGLEIISTAPQPLIVSSNDRLSECTSPASSGHSDLSQLLVALKQAALVSHAVGDRPSGGKGAVLGAAEEGGPHDTVIDPLDEKQQIQLRCNSLLSVAARRRALLTHAAVEAVERALEADR